MKNNFLKKYKTILFVALLCVSTVHTQYNSFLDAIVRNDIDLVNYMIKHRANVNMTNSDGLTPLHLVSDLGIAITLIQNGADINRTNISGSTPLHWAASRSQTKIAQLLIEFGADPNVQDNNGNSPLHLAINASEEMILLLIRSEANVNIKNKNGSTPIIKALLQNHNRHSKYLLLAGAEDIKNNSGVTPSILETLEKDDSIKQAISSGQVNPLIKEIFIENYPQAISLIRQNTPIDRRDVNGNTPLHWAFIKKQRYISKLLLQRNADYEAYNYKDQTPLDILLKSKDTNFIQYIQKLLKNKTNFYKPNKNSKSVDK